MSLMSPRFKHGLLIYCSYPFVEDLDQDLVLGE